MSYTIVDRASAIYGTAVEVFDYTKNSDVVTPLRVVRDQVKGIDPASTVCVPGAGIGTYVLSLLEVGICPSNITAIEYDKGYYMLGSAMFQRFGVNYVCADFLSWDPKMKFDVVIGNPPYGKNASLAVKFLNKAVELSDHISFVLPRTFRKPSILNRIHPSLHLVEDVDTSDDTFGGTIITCRQKWERRDVKRGKIKTYTSHPDLQFVSKKESNVAIGRVGAGPAGKVLIADYGHLTEQHYFLRVTDSVRERLLVIQPKLRELARAATVGMPSLSKHELISAYLGEV